MDNIETTEAMIPVTRLSRDIVKAMGHVGIAEARYLCDMYYVLQDNRKAAGNQVRALNESGEPHEVIQWLFAQNEVLEQQIKRALDKWTDTMPISVWCKQIVGIGPVIAAGLRAHLEIKGHPTVGAWWRFGGYDPTCSWEKGEKRPWNAALKCLLWKVGCSFTKVSGNANDFYGKLIISRKLYEQAHNDAGDYADQARAKLEKFKIAKNTDAWPWYAGCYPGGTTKEWSLTIPERRAKYLEGVRLEPGKGVPMLPPAHIQQRAQRWSTKLFLAHYHAVAYWYEYGEKPPKPYVISILGHADIIDPPNAPWL
jgi:hypothetical protein